MTKFVSTLFSVFVIFTLVRGTYVNVNPKKDSLMHPSATISLVYCGKITDSKYSISNYSRWGVNSYFDTSEQIVSFEGATFHVLSVTNDALEINVIKINSMGKILYYK